MPTVRYARVYFNQGSKPVTLEVTSETPEWLRGWEVDRRTGDRLERKHLIHWLAIRRVVPLQMNLTYAELEQVPTFQSDALGRVTIPED